MPDLNYELAPRQGQPASQRKQELDGARFIAIRNLAYMTYKKPDGTPLLSYAETLDDRERVKGMIIQHELALGLLVNDGGAVAAQPQPQPAMPAAQQAGVPQMAQQPVPVMQFQPQPAATPQQAAQVPQQQFQQQPQFQQPPMPQQQQYQQPAPQMQAQPQQMQMQLPIQQQQQQPAAPAQAAAAGEAAPTGRKRRGAGAAVAPPPAAPPPSGPVQPVYGAPPQGQMPGQAQQFQQPAQVPQFQPQMQAPQFQPQAAPQFAPQQAPMNPGQFPTATAPQKNAVANVDLTPVLQQLDLLGKGLEIAADNSDTAMKAVADLKSDLNLILIAMNHIYVSMPAAQGQQTLGQLTQGRANDLPSFRTYLSQYLPK